MPLRIRLALLLALATAVLVSLVALVFLLQLRSSLDASLDTSLQGRGAVIADQYADGGAAALRLTQDEEPVQVLTPDGRIVASSPGVAAGPVIDASTRTAVLDRDVARDGPLSFTQEAGDDSTRYQVSVLPGPPTEILVVGTGTDVAEAADDRVEQGFFVLGPPTVLAAGLAAWWLAGAALRPVDRMRRQTAELSEHDDGTHLAVPTTRDEIAALAHTMNGLLDRLRGALEHERGFVADAGHELRTPLATLRAELELAGRPGRSAGELRAAVTVAAHETERLIRLAEDMLLLARAQGGRPFLRPGATDLADLARVAARGAATRAEGRGLDIAVEGPEHLELVADGDRLRQAVDNVLANAVQHAPPGGRIRVALDLVDDGRTARVAVEDTGPGFPPEFLPHAFERFRRADTARSRADGGAGLGLAIVAAVVGAHDGSVTAENRHPVGARVVMDLPALAAGTAAPRPARTPAQQAATRPDSARRSSGGGARSSSRVPSAESRASRQA